MKEKSIASILKLVRSPYIICLNDYIKLHKHAHESMLLCMQLSPHTCNLVVQ
jgi:hypothetical protein